MEKIIRRTRSICPVCRKNLPAQLVQKENGEVWICRECPAHGISRALIWKDQIDFEDWTSGVSPMEESAGTRCPEDCGLCPEHERGTCCILLEVTKACNLNCRFCFAHGGEDSKAPSADNLKKQIKDIVQKCGKVLLQFSGGEPTLRDDLPELVSEAKAAGCSYTQVNTNGIRLAQDIAYVRALAQAGLDIVFLQFDGTDDGIYRYLRGRDLLAVKMQAIRNCAACGLGVTLVPTVVQGINDQELGNILKLAAALSPAVKGVHFQPVTYLGRHPGQAPEDRYTLDQLIADLCAQSGLHYDEIEPSHCDHPLCGLHSTLMIDPEGAVIPMSRRVQKSKSIGSGANRKFIGRHWSGQGAEAAEKVAENTAAVREIRKADGGSALHVPDFLIRRSMGEMDFETFLDRMHHHSLVVSAMDFQDETNMNVERLHRCSLHVYRDGRVVPFCAAYL